jgi:sporulation protein YlmC with PRC-barrel domain
MIMAAYGSKTEQRVGLVKLGDTDLTVADRSEDVRGYKVFDSAGEELGKVSNLIIDEAQAKVRFLEVTGGGFLGIGDHTVLVPVDAVTRISDEKVYVNQTREHVAGGPRYDPALAVEESFWTSNYEHYGVAPYWSTGYTYPSYPIYR